MYMLNFMTLGCPLMYSLKLQRLGMADKKMLIFYFQVTCCFLAEILVLFFSDAFFTSRAQWLEVYAVLTDGKKKAGISKKSNVLSLRCKKVCPKRK